MLITIYSLTSNDVECLAEQNNWVSKPQVMAKLCVTVFDTAEFGGK